MVIYLTVFFWGNWFFSLTPTLKVRVKEWGWIYEWLMIAIFVHFSLICRLRNRSVIYQTVKSNRSIILLFLLLSVLSGCEFLTTVNKNFIASPVIEPLKPFDYTTLEVKAYPSGKHDSEVLSITKLPDDSLYQFVTIGKDGNVLLWSVSSKTPYLALKIENGIDSATFDPMHGLIAWIKGSTVSVAPINFNYQYQYELPSRIESMNFTNDGQSLLLGGKDARIYRWRFALTKNAKTKKETEKIVERYVGAGKVISSVIPHPDGNLFFSSDWAGAVQGWQLYTGDRLKGEGIESTISSTFFSTASVRTNSKREVKDERIEKMALDNSGKELLVGTSYGDIELWKVRGLLQIATIKAHQSDIFSVSFSPDSQKVATAGRDGLLRVYSIHHFTDEELRAKTDRKQQAELILIKSFPLLYARTLTFINNHQIVAGTKDGSVLLVDIL
jgi:WD40 repeat protein